MAAEFVTLTHPSLPPDQTITKRNRDRTLDHYKRLGWKRTSSSSTSETTTTATSRRTTTKKESH